MNTSLENLTHKMQRAAVGKMVDVVLSHADKDPEKTMGQIVDLAKQFYGSSFSDETYERAKKTLSDPDSKWSKLINCVLDQTDPNVARTMALNLGYEAFFRGTKTIRENRVKYQCNIPWLILFDPTSACNMHCVGCWAGEYGHKNNLSFEDMDKIVTEGKELGVYLYMLTGGEPLVRKADILKLAEKHNDVQFAIYTNSTLIDEPFCKEVVRLGNIAFMLSIEGTPETNDARRGKGHYAAVMNAMDLLKKYGIIFGTSICYTRDNILFTKNFDYCTCFEYSISDYGNIGIDSSASGKSYPSSNCDTSGYHIEISSIFETRCALYKTRDENEGRGIVFLENSKSSGADIRRLFNPYTYAPSDDGDRIIRISGNARHQLSL